MKRINKANDKSLKKTIIIYALTFVVLVFLCALFPYTGDDWAWGSSIGLHRLENWFDGYGGRYLGNLIVIALTRSNALKSVVMSGVITGILILLNEMTGRSKTGIRTIAVLLALMSVPMLRQSIVWTAGFSNYATSIMLTLIYIYEIKDIFTKCPENRFIASLPLAVLGFCNALIVEHLTLFNIALGGFVIVFVLIKYKKVRIQHIAYLLGVAGGTVLMFSNSAYSKVANNTDSYRTIAISDMITRAKENFKETIMISGFAENWLLMLMIAIVCLLVLVKSFHKLSSFRKAASVLFYLPIAAYAVISIGYCVNSLISATALPTRLISYSTIVFVISLPLFVLTLDLFGEMKLRLLFLIGCAYVMIAPLFVVTPIGSRCFFAPYVMMIFFVAEMYNILDKSSIKMLDKYSVVMTAMTVLSVAALFYVYGEINIADKERLESFSSSVDDTGVVEVCDLPHSEFVWCSKLNNKVWKERYKKFYGIDESIKIKWIEKK